MNVPKLISKIEESYKNYPTKIFATPNKIYTCINPYKYHMVRKNTETFMSMDGIFVDGILRCKFIRILFGTKVNRISFDMTSMAKDLFPLLEKNGQSIYFIGDEEKYIHKAVSVYHNFYPKINIKGCHSGFFKDEKDREDVIRFICNLSPDFTVVGMGGVIQEKFALDLKSAGYKGIVFTCGGFFHQSAEKIEYYPNIINKLNLRAAYRMVKEGTYKRLWHILLSFPIFFIFDIIKSKTTK